MRTIKAFLIDQDDTLTRHSNKDIYHRGAHRALTALLRQHGREAEAPPFAEWQAFHHGIYESNECHFTMAAERYSFDRREFFALMHVHMDDSDIAYDNDSVPYLQSIADRAVIFTDAGRPWAEKRAGVLSHGLQILARDDEDALFERKQAAGQRWDNAIALLSAKVGAPLSPGDIMMIDDSAKVLLKAQSLGMATAHCHWGFPGREPVPGFDYTIGSVSELKTLLHA